MRFGSIYKQKALRALFVTAFSLVFVITGITVAFGDFAAPSSSKVLGVGRIQSNHAEDLAGTESKFATYNDEKVAQISVLSAPISRDATVVQEVIESQPEPQPQPTPDPKPAQQPEQPKASESSTPDVSMDEQEMLNWIINRESSGNVYATNGRYMGLGQLQEHHYQQYVGMSYAETLEQPNVYELQVQAMLGYIYQRYGTITAAYNFWQANNWY